ncbi:MAG: hypothetical protein AAGD07_09245 [Planctomycetota bacterium]
MKQLGIPALMLLIAACDQRDSDGPPVYPVEGSVYFQGTPAAGAMVTLHPIVGSIAHDLELRPVARVDEEGRFRLRTYGLGEGAPAGSYSLTLYWPPETPSDPSEAIRQQFGPQDAARRKDSFQIPGGPRDRLQGKYYLPEDSIWSVTIPEDAPGATHTIPRIDLKK